MKANARIRQAIALLIVSATLLAVQGVQACAVCMGSDDLKLQEASNAVLWALLALVGFIFTATGATVFYLWKKANTPIPAHVRLVESLNPSADIED